jgi:hypothetical protein
MLDMMCITPSEVNTCNASGLVAVTLEESSGKGTDGSDEPEDADTRDASGLEAKTARMQLTYIRAISNWIAGSSVRLLRARREGVAVGSARKVCTLGTVHQYCRRGAAITRVTSASPVG